MKNQEFIADQEKEILSIVSDFLMWDDLDKMKDFLFELQNLVLYNTAESTYTEEETDRITGNFNVLYGLIAELKRFQNIPQTLASAGKKSFIPNIKIQK